MKATAPPAKRRRGPRLAVLALVFCSLLVPIAFLFNRFPAGESSASSRYDPTPAEPPDLGECRRRRGSDQCRATRIYSSELCSLCYRAACRISDFVVALLFIGIFRRFDF
jgi:hypothetical protein